MVADPHQTSTASPDRADAGFHDRTRSGELVSRLTPDAERSATSFGMRMSIALRSTITAIGALVMLFVTSPRLAAAWALVGIPVAAGAGDRARG